MTTRQMTLILGLAIMGIAVPNFTLGLCLMCAAIGAFLCVVIE